MFRSDLLYELIKKSGISRRIIADAIKVSESSLRHLLEGKITPKIETVEKIADYFAVPIDVLCDRCTLEEEKNILKNYDKNFMILRRAPYEAYLYGKLKPKYSIVNKYIAPYPYNLIEDLMGHAVTRIIDDNIEKKLINLMDIFSQRQKTILLMYYKDGKSKDDIAEEYKVTKERIRQIINYCISRLKYPSYIRCIENSIVLDLKETEITADYEKKKMVISEQQEEIEQLKSRLSEQQQEIEQLKSKILEQQQDVLAHQEEAHNKLTNLKDLIFPEKECYISTLNFSARTYNVLMRHFQRPYEYKNSNEMTIQELFELIVSKKVKLVDCLGKRAITEILSKFDTHFGSGTAFEDFYLNSMKYLNS